MSFNNEICVSSKDVLDSANKYGKDGVLVCISTKSINDQGEDY
jgi:hypothetical protein